MNKTIRNLTFILIIASVAFFSGCAGQEISTPAPVSTPTGHEQAGEPDMSYLGLADVFSGRP